MRRKLLLSVMVLVPFLQDIHGQERPGGEVTYITSRHVYVRFGSTDHIAVGDTLFMITDRGEVPVLRVENKSSVSCLCTPVGELQPALSDKVYARVKTEPVLQAVTDTVPGHPETPDEDHEEGRPADRTATRDDSEKITLDGRISVSSYTDLSEADGHNRQRMRYTWSMKSVRPGKTGFSAESYVSFVHSSSNWPEIRENIFEGLKIYNLALRYDREGSFSLLLGRKINPKLCSAGAIDGLQFEKGFGSFGLGAFAGSRPDHRDYSFDPGLLQFGGYFFHQAGSGNLKNSVALIQQMNGMSTDRRFLYFQHQSRPLENLDLFASLEADLYTATPNKTGADFRLTNTYLSARYRIIRPLSVGLSYSARNNIIFYETYKDYLERLLETETLHGWRGMISFHPLRNLYLGIHAGYRKRGEDALPSRNLYGFLTFRNLPGTGATMTLTSLLLETSYLRSSIQGLALSRSFLDERMNLSLKYRYVRQLINNSETSRSGHIGEGGISWHMFRKLTLMASYEG
ncbi:MAG: hypothetical protein EHM46_02850, partial [Bacteroidetes bacterium]